MQKIDEQYRIESYVDGEIPRSTGYTLIRFECSNIDSCLKKLVVVIKMISVSDHNDWPDDSFWLENLPQWLLETFHTYSPHELNRIMSEKSSWSFIRWSFGSWIDRMRDREWEWWSIGTTDGIVTICLKSNSHPYSLQPIEHLITSAGGELLEVNSLP